MSIKKTVEHTNRCGGDPCCTGSCMDRRTTWTNSHGLTVSIPTHLIDDLVDRYSESPAEKPEEKCECFNGFPHIARNGEPLMSGSSMCPCDCHKPKCTNARQMNPIAKFCSDPVRTGSSVSDEIVVCLDCQCPVRCQPSRPLEGYTKEQIDESFGRFFDRHEREEREFRRELLKFLSDVVPPKHTGERCRECDNRLEDLRKKFT